jgi:hypothetical protein
VTAYRVTPVPEPISRDLADRFERRRGLVVVGDPGHVVPPDWSCFGMELPRSPGRRRCSHHPKLREFRWRGAAPN